MTPTIEELVRYLYSKNDKETADLISSKENKETIFVPYIDGYIYAVSEGKVTGWVKAYGSDGPLD